MSVASINSVVIEKISHFLLLNPSLKKSLMKEPTTFWRSLKNGINSGNNTISSHRILFQWSTIHNPPHPTNWLFNSLRTSTTPWNLRYFQRKSFFKKEIFFYKLAGNKNHPLFENLLDLLFEGTEQILWQNLHFIVHPWTHSKFQWKPRASGPHFSVLPHKTRQIIKYSVGSWAPGSGIRWKIWALLNNLPRLGWIFSFHWSQKQSESQERLS